MLLFLVLVMVTWQALSPQPAQATLLINDKLGHFFVFLILAVIADHAYATTFFNWNKFAWLISYGIAIEILQYYIPGREFSLLDIAADTAGLLVYSILTKTVIHRTLTPPRELKN